MHAGRCLTLAALAIFLGFSVGCGGNSAPAPATSIEGAPSPVVSEATQLEPQFAAENSRYGAAIEPAMLDAPPEESRYGGVADGLTPVEPTAEPAVETAPETPAEVVSQAAGPDVLISTNYGDIRVRLHGKRAPRTVTNFVNYVRQGFYDDTIVHYVAKGSMIAAGGFSSKLVQKDVGAVIVNESNNGLSNRRGTIAMICEQENPHSATSQFFFNVSDNVGLDFKETDQGPQFGYAVFGDVVSGLNVLDEISQVTVADGGGFESKPVQPVVISRVTVVE